MATFYLMNDHIYEFIEIDENKNARLVYWEWVDMNDKNQQELPQLEIIMSSELLKDLKELTEEEIEELMYK